jgi:hypothetical protein
MQQLLIGLYQSWPCLVVFVTHDVTEALMLGDRVIVLSTQPARVADDFLISEPRPRSAAWQRSRETQALEERILEPVAPGQSRQGPGQGHHLAHGRGRKPSYVREVLTSQTNLYASSARWRRRRAVDSLRLRYRRSAADRLCRRGYPRRAAHSRRCRPFATRSTGAGGRRRGRPRASS